MAVHMRNGIQYGGIPNGTVKGTTPSTVPTTVKQLNQIGTVGDIAPVTIPSAVKFSNGNTLETAIGSVATIETSPAVATHAVGDYVFYNGQMYKVIAAIAVGETLTVDTNIEATSVGEELTALNKGLNIITVTGSDGNAVKFPDGTMFVYGTKNVSLGTAVTTQHITFPASFVGAPTITISTGAGGVRTEAYVEDIGTSGFNAYFNARSASSTSWFRYIAMGRWKS